MTWEELEKAYEAIPVVHRASYLGLFQGYAYIEGAANAVQKFRLPEEDSFQLDPDDWKATGFSIRDLMVCVAHFDNEGNIFYFRFDKATNPNYDIYTDHFLYLACTEDDSFDAIDGQPNWQTAWTHAELLTKED
jgi:hypothetical protein